MASKEDREQRYNIVGPTTSRTDVMRRAKDGERQMGWELSKKELRSLRRKSTQDQAESQDNLP